ncbi:hypothetical protein ACFLTZ_03090 [Chloroflexota bacterium]
MSAKIVQRASELNDILLIEMTKGDPRFANLEKIGVHHYDLL